MIKKEMNGLIISQNKEVYNRFIVELKKCKILERLDFSEIEKDIKSEKYNIIILDFTQFYNCKNLIEIINQIRKRIPIIAVLNTEQVEYEVEIECLCVDIVLKYPIEGKEFQECIEKAKLLIWYYEWKVKRETKDMLENE